MSKRIDFVVLAGFAVLIALAFGTPVTHAEDRAERLEHGKYLLTIGGCNDCHSPNGFEKGPAVPEKDWLVGVPIGFQGPWGTTYPANLRLVIAGMTESQWVEHARQERMPPMPWYSLRAMSDADLKAIYAYVRSLGAAGVPAPAYVAPGGKVTTPYFVFVPQEDRKQAAAR
jgi:mono/diheme cytochrome c family protein